MMGSHAFASHQGKNLAAVAHHGAQRTLIGDGPAFHHRASRKAKSVVAHVASRTLLEPGELTERQDWTSHFTSAPFHTQHSQELNQQRVAGDDLIDDDVAPESRCVGTILGSLCGNALAAPVQHERHYQVARLFPNGLTEFWAHDMGRMPVKRGHATGEFEALLAVARSLVAANCCDARSVAHWLAYRCNTKTRRYTPHAEYIISRLQHTSARKESLRFLASLPIQAAQQIALDPLKAALSFSDRWDREPWGPADHTAAAAVAAPIALAYRLSSWEVVDKAVQEACMLSHSHPVGLDGARVMAAAVHWLLQQPAPSGTQGTAGVDAAVGPRALLAHLLSVTQTQDMRTKLELLQQQLFQVDEIQSWKSFCRSEDWHKLRTVLSRVTYHDMATAGTEATAVSLWAFVTHWNLPHQAVCVSALFGGSGPATTQMVGALAGALHGTSWIPGSWWEQVENVVEEVGTRADVEAWMEPVGSVEAGIGKDGQVVDAGVGSGRVYEGAYELKVGRVLGLRDEAAMVARQLSELRCTKVGLPESSGEQ